LSGTSKTETAVRVVISIILAATLAGVPAQQATQVDHQEQAVTDSTTPPQSRIGVPVVEGGKAALLWQARNLKPATDSVAYHPGRQASNGGDKAGIIIMAGFTVLLILLVALEFSDGFLWGK
jgi:hypothetical protein